ncbi:MAG TPA: GAF and ANTAR domain-containing protein [Marmoricola sp.]
MPIDPSGGALEVAARFAELSQQLLAEHDERKLFAVICDRAEEYVPGVDFCGITLRGPRRRLETACATSSLAQECDDAQRELGEGPCLEAAHDVQQLFVATDVGSDARWPKWGPRAAALGVGSLVSVELSSHTINDEHAPLGALNMYSRRPRRFLEEEVAIARTYAVHCANALAQARLVTGLERAVESRHRIGMAQGVLLQRYGLDPETAFDVLQRYSTTTNTKLRDVAGRVIEQGGLPEPHGD